MISSDLLESLLLRLNVGTRESRRELDRPSHDHDICSPTYISSHLAVFAVEKEVKVVAGDYLKAIEISVKMAGHGFTFAGDAVRLCEFLIQDPSAEVGKFIDEMQQIARLAQGDANYAYKAFSDVRDTLIQVCIRILFPLELLIEGTNRSSDGLDPRKRRMKEDRIPSPFLMTPPPALLRCTGEVSVCASVIVRSLNDT
jgi:hypothetical protein